ncbi:MAG: ABC transporter ATP-binding protein [Brochothrix thermosphacta]|uniref:ABC transporter ATP-binding protein n=1 Tax=Brochothrix thermosphacta TaxID=2756 RepID=UPI000D7980EB|nr:ABC transporter ATP-binding protein [Brochothrix thermosphacta]SPP25918.1 putative ABC transporter ATP-binding protein [Brochothrix thermosphacta]
MTYEIVSMKKVNKKFSGKTALENISFSILKGEIFGFLGPSGSGKTTTINILTGQLAQDSGEAYLLGKAVSELGRTEFSNMGIVSDTSGFYEKMTVYKNLLIYAKIHGVLAIEITNLLQNVGLLEHQNKLASELSTGMRQRMLLARAMINRPHILFLDEPTSGLDPYTSKKIHQLLLELQKQGTTIFLTTHDMEEATLLCNEIVLLNKGILIESGNPKELIAKYTQESLVIITNDVGKQTTVRFKKESLDKYCLDDTFSIHSCEPTLSQIFIRLTGDK